VKITLKVGIDEEVMNMQKDELLVLDEADWHLLDECKDLPVNSFGVIGMTATEVGRKDGHEEKRMK